MRSLIMCFPMKLAPTTPCGRYALADRVLSDEARSDDVMWKRMDCTVLSWLYGTINPELLEVVMNRDDGPPTARLVWLGLEQQFIGNKETRALLLDAEFRTFVQANLSISDYCHRLKSMADQLVDLGEPVHDHTLVLNVIRGLNERFSYLGALIQCQRPFPTFAEVKSDLRLAEINMTAKHAQLPHAPYCLGSSSSYAAIAQLRWNRRWSQAK
jgi:hypothetical protein